MNYTFLPSLEHIVLVKIATTLWNQSDIRALLVKFEFKGWLTGEELIKLKNVEEKIKEKVLLLNYPSSLKEKILCVIKPIGLEIYRWMKCNKKSYNLALNLPDEFSWTPHGTIDRKRTAEALMKDETIDITERYKLACIYCLENYVGTLWEKMPENHRASFYSEDDPRKVAQHDLVVIWTYDIKGEMAKLENIIRWRRRFRWTVACTPEQYPFKCALIHRNKVAAEYFWSKLSLEDREDSLRFMVNNWGTLNYVFVLRDVSDGFDGLRFVFSLVNNQQIALFEQYQFGMLVCFLQWPWQRLFMDMANHVVLKNWDYSDLLKRIYQKVIEGYKDYDYQRLFGEFWNKGTEYNKKYVIGTPCHGNYLLLHLFRNKDMKNISLILKDATVREKAAVCDGIGMRIFEYLYYDKMFDMIEFFINEFISSHEMMIKFKDKCMKEYSWHYHRLEKFLEDLIQKFNLKRNLEESQCSSAKRLCSSSDMQL